MRVSADAGATAASTGHPAYQRLRRRTERLLGSWPAPDEEQEALRREFLTHLVRNPDAMAKSGPPAHFTASCLVLNPDRTQVLLTLHRKARRWLQFGGHFEVADSGPLDASAREAREESGLKHLDLHPHLVQLDRHTLATAFGRCREHLDLRFAAVAQPGTRHAASAESLDVRWWPVARIPEGSREEIATLAAAALRVLPSS